jgi:hypothetical protein
MTTVAFDGKTLAADNMMVARGGIPIVRTKIYKTTKNSKWKAVGAAGNSYCIVPVVDYIRGVSKKVPEQFPEEEGTILLIDKNNKPWMMNGKQVPIEVCVPFAIGSGGDYALGAMAAGKTASEAVAIAATLDVNTGKGIDEIIIRS